MLRVIINFQPLLEGNKSLIGISIINAGQGETDYSLHNRIHNMAVANLAVSVEQVTGRDFLQRLAPMMGSKSNQSALYFEWFK